MERDYTLSVGQVTSSSEVNLCWINMSKKNAPLISRPEPPSVEKIVEDIGSAHRSDVVFTLANLSNNG